MAENKDIYKSLEVNCEDFNRIPINRRELGMTGVATSYTLSIGGALADYKMDKYLESQNVSSSIRKFSTLKITTNFGILSFLYKKVEGKSNERATTETIIESGMGHFAVKTGVSLLTRIATGAATGAAVGSTAPIVGTIIGAITGALIAGMVNDYIFAEEDEQLEKDKAHNAEIERLEKEYKLKIDRINDYLIRNYYIELRELTEAESEELCKEVSNLKNSYFKTIMLMQSFPNYLDRDKEFYDTLQEKELDASKDSKETNSTESKQLHIKPIADSIPLTIEIEKCHNGISGNLLRNTTIYIYNHRFKRVVAKGKSDNNGKLIVHNVYVGKEYTIDKLSFIPDRDNFDESNFELSLSQYESFTNIQKKHKNTKELKLLQAYFSFNGLKLSLEYEYEVSNLKANIYKDTIELIPTHNLKDTRFRQYIKYAYMVFDITDSNIDEKTSNITIANRAMLGLKNLGKGGNNKYQIRESWKDKIVVFFAYFDKQEKTPCFKASFINKPIVILDIGDSGALATKYEQKSVKRKDIISSVIDKLSNNIKPIVYPIIQSFLALKYRHRLADYALLQRLALGLYALLHSL
ncbi:hypothetical protein [Helicobacter bilis]|uniref:hypothetical protein n=3 Tax=Helicobacter bilis TaxID=37372 RepID=UPI002A833CC6|nr:hypothetical protein [Helicobacter bilis]MDY4399556.1 hypothetical protein [Helicobacter bilis]